MQYQRLNKHQTATVTINHFKRKTNLFYEAELNNFNQMSYTKDQMSFIIITTACILMKSSVITTIILNKKIELGI